VTVTAQLDSKNKGTYSRRKDLGGGVREGTREPSFLNLATEKGGGGNKVGVVEFWGGKKTGERG